MCNCFSFNLFKGNCKPTVQYLNEKIDNSINILNDSISKLDTTLNAKIDTLNTQYEVIHEEFDTAIGDILKNMNNIYIGEFLPVCNAESPLLCIINNNQSANIYVKKYQYKITSNTEYSEQLYILDDIIDAIAPQYHESYETTLYGDSLSSIVFNEEIIVLWNNDDVPQSTKYYPDKLPEHFVYLKDAYLGERLSVAKTYMYIKLI